MKYRSSIMGSVGGQRNPCLYFQLNFLSAINPIEHQKSFETAPSDPEKWVIPLHIWLPIQVLYDDNYHSTRQISYWYHIETICYPNLAILLKITFSNIKFKKKTGERNDLTFRPMDKYRHFQRGKKKKKKNCIFALLRYISVTKTQNSKGVKRIVSKFFWFLRFLSHF